MRFDQHCEPVESVLVFYFDPLEFMMILLCVSTVLPVSVAGKASPSLTQWAVAQEIWPTSCWSSYFVSQVWSVMSGKRHLHILACAALPELPL